MARATEQNTDDWMYKARGFYIQKNWIGALSSVRNALRLDARNIAAWSLGSEILMAQDRQREAGRFAKALKRFAISTGSREGVEFAEKRLAEVAQYFATLHLRYGETDLTHFAGRGDIDKVKALLESGVDPNERNRTNWTALHCLGMQGNPEIARLLVEHGADLEATDTLQETPLITACRFGNPKLIPILLELGANVGHVSKEKHTALWYAISSMKDVAIVKMLIDAGADPNETYAYGDNPLLLSASAQKPEVVYYLLPLTQDVSRINDHEVDAIGFAASYDDTDLIKKLLELGVDVNLTTKSGFTPLISALTNGRLKAARLLIERGANCFAETKYGESAIAIARRCGYDEILGLMERRE